MSCWVLSRMIWDQRDSWTYFRTAFVNPDIASGSGYCKAMHGEDEWYE